MGTKQLDKTSVHLEATDFSLKLKISREWNQRTMQAKKLLLSKL